MATIARPALRQLVRVELRKSSDTRAGRWMLGLITAAAVGGILLLLIFGHPEDRDFSGFLFTSQLPMALLVPVLGILAMTGEWSQRTALQTFALVPNRTRVLWAKVLGLVSLALLLVLASVIAAALATLIAGLGSGGHWDSPGNAVGRVTLFEVLAVLTGAGFGLALLNAPAAIVGFFVLPSLITALVSLISALSGPMEWLNFVQSVTRLLGDHLGGREWGQLVVSVLVWSLVPLVIGALRVDRRDVQ